MNNVNQFREVSTSREVWAAANHDEFTSSPVPVNEVKRYATDCMVSVGVQRDHASALADVLVAADYRGHYSHGLNRLGKKKINIKHRKSVIICNFILQKCMFKIFQQKSVMAMPFQQ